MNRLRVGFFSIHNPYNRVNFSGVPYYMLQALEAHPAVEVVVMGAHLRPLPGWAGRIQKKFRPRTPLDLARVTEPEDLDLILSVVSTRFVAEEAARMRAPVFHVTDATPAFLREVYGRDIPPQKDALEAECLAHAAAAVYSSDYMAARALREFPDLSPDRVHAFPFGLNLDDIPAAVPEKPPLDPLNLLFVGSDWQRKGGTLAVEVLDALRTRGVDATLTVMGNDAAGQLGHAHVRGLGFVDKNSREGRALFARELSRAHLLLHPTRADCSAMVVAEANVYGCPVAVTDVGGIPSVMDPGRNGVLFDLTDGPEEIADAITAMTGDAETYRGLSRSSRRHYEEKLTWRTWADTLLAIAPARRAGQG
ncbi:glycosyltransferase family 4 protein [uncultured Roseobacter sp.]|uniref:glycosyltransferase family 4 protein n=1 Tax=uncultured Roseobacter sp. TaxID=114847 RepID=UPI00260D86F8|nr:glycosyltransferase family 4 protein [uncultured Roseobacter sp.]